MYKGKFCKMPFEAIQIDQDGDVMLCGCADHMPYVIGNIYKDTLQNMWLNEKASQVRQAVVDEDFTYCHWACPMLSSLKDRPEILPTLVDFPKIIKLDMDRSCNLQCPSCREHIIIEKYSNRIKRQIEIFNEVTQWAKDNPTKQISIWPVASGEIFASHSGLEFLRSLVDYPYNNIQLTISTNGTLINKNKELIKNIKHLINDFTVSIDAATPETYSIVRGGDWQELMSGLEFINSLHLSSRSRYNFVIQKNNCHEIKEFAELCRKFYAFAAYQKLCNWGHWNKSWWDKNDIFVQDQSSCDQVFDDIKQIREKYPNYIKLGSGSLVNDFRKYLAKT